MTRLGSADRALFAAVMLLWATAFGAQLRQLAHGRMGWVPLYLEGAASPQALPGVVEPWPPAAGDPPSELRAGDRIARVGAVDARGLGRVELTARLFAAAGPDLRVPLEVEREDGPHALTLALQPVAAWPWRTALLSLAFAGIGALAFRRGGSPARRAFFLSAVFYALHWSAFPGGGRLHTAFVMVLTALAPAVAGPMALRTVLYFPSEIALHGRAASLGPWLFALNGLFVFSWVFGFPLPPALGRPLALGGTLALIAALLVSMLVQYRRADAGGRRQLRWALLGLYVGLTGPALLAGLSLAVPPLWWVYHLSLCAVVALPIGLFIGLDRHHLLDVDRLIGAAASYSALVGIALAVLLGAAPSASAALSEATSLDPRTSQTLLAVALGLAIVPAHRALRPRLEQLLFRERHALERGIGRLQRDLDGCEKPEEVFDLLTTRLEELLRPDTVALYGLVDEVFAPLVARGRAIAPAFEAGGALPALLEQSAAPLDVVRLRRRGRRAGLAPGESAALDTMGVQLVVPLALDEELVAFLCLGEKESGDIYTETDRALLQSLADHVGAELRRFGEEATRREERAMMAKLRRYVPGSIAEELAAGGALEEGEREVTVLFVDVRGYTSFAQDRAAPEIFASVNRYTRAVSEAVRGQGGSIVEFNGDGMMAVFGAPEPQAHKEGAAVAAAREIVAGVPELPGARGELSAGVGIATGQAFVGNIQAVDRMIWTALGNTTNLASRLQQLTREVPAAIVIDRRTFELAGAEAVAFLPYVGAPIRGRMEREDVFLLPLLSAA